MKGQAIATILHLTLNHRECKLLFWGSQWKPVTEQKTEPVCTRFKGNALITGQPASLRWWPRCGSSRGKWQKKNIPNSHTSPWFASVCIQHWSTLRALGWSHPRSLHARRKVGKMKRLQPHPVLNCSRYSGAQLNESIQKKYIYQQSRAVIWDRMSLSGE